MKIEARNIHIINGLRRIQSDQDHPQALGVLGLNPCCGARFIEAAKSLVPKRLDHRPSVPRCATRIKCRLTFEVSRVP